MSGGSVCVLALNGRRQIVKCTPNTTILQILEEVCKKQGLKPEEYDLKHHNKILDTTTIFRFSGLPNNAQLELVQAVKTRSETDITLAVNLENGNRLMGNFSPNETLLNILNKLCPESIQEDKNPVIIYTRREIFGKELENVTLRSLGLTGGRAMVRLIDRSPEELKTQANVSVCLPHKPTEEKPYQRKFQHLPSPPKEVDEGDSSKGSEIDRDYSEKDVAPKPENFVKNPNVDILKLAREKRKLNEPTIPQNEEKRQVIDIQSNMEKETELKNRVCKCQHNELMDIDCCGECNKCTSRQKYIEDFIFLGERNAMLFSLETAQAVPSEELPDDFFELTIDDARKILRDVKKQRHYMENSPLMTSTLRNLEESKKQLRQINKYKKAIIRIQFPDRTILQGTFAPTDNIGHVLDFVREYLENKSMNFYVYSTPPKCILEEDKHLMELGFVPGAMIYFGTDTENKKDSFLRRDLHDKFTSNSIASLAAAKMRRLNTRVCDEEMDDEIEIKQSASTDTNVGASTSSGITHENYGERKIVKSTENVPKWFRP